MTDTHFFYARSTPFEVREDGAGDVEWETIGTPTYDSAIVVSLDTDAVLELADEIKRLRNRAARKQSDE